MSDTPRTDEASADEESMREHAEIMREHAEIMRELVAMTAERDRNERALRDNGFVMCDVSACNCNNWHHRYGLPERMYEYKSLLAEAGHPLGNNNGHLISNAIKELISERDRLKKDNYILIQTFHELCHRKKIPKLW